MIPTSYKLNSYLCYETPSVVILFYHNIGDNIYTDGVWQPTLDTFFPVQMCHMEVRDGYRVWHGACHLDDALQAPVNHKHFDGYTQYSETDTPFPPLTHIPNLDVGGWHDAGDYDLAAGSQASTTRRLAHTRELFGIDRDQMSVDRHNRRVMLHQPDGIPDLVQQVTHGVENLLSGYRACGHSFSGIIENSLGQYVHLGDPVTMTDNRVTEGAGSDDRWAFTNRDSATEYAVCGALAASARVLRGWDDTLADECLATAQKIWLYENTHPVKVARSSYTPGRAELQAIVAAAELLVSTEDEVFQQFLVSQTGLITETFVWIGWAVAMAAPKINNPAFQDVIRSAIKQHMEKLASEAAQNPFGVPYSADTWRQQSPVWGVAWNLLSRAADLFYMHRAFPDVVDPQITTRHTRIRAGLSPGFEHIIGFRGRIAIVHRGLRDQSRRLDTHPWRGYLWSSPASPELSGTTRAFPLLMAANRVCD